MNKIGLTFAILLVAITFSCKSQNFFWSHRGVVEEDILDLTTCVEYGLLYNSYAIDYSTGDTITSSDEWTIPTYDQAKAFADSFGAGGNYYWNSAGKHLKDTSSVYWTSLHDGATNDYNFSARGSSDRAGVDGVYTTQKIDWNIKLFNTSRAMVMYNDTSRIAIAIGSYEYNAGRSLRLIKDATGYSTGDTTQYIGNDGQIYNAIVMPDGNFWITDNLKETLYRDGSIIPFHGIDNDTSFTDAEWAALTTAGVCAYDNDVSYVGCDFEWPTLDPCFGYLYNWYAVDDSRELTSSDDWSVPTTTQHDALISYAGGTTVAGGKLKKTGEIFWQSPNTGATDDYLFAAIGGGERDGVDGLFKEMKTSGDMWSSTAYPFAPFTGAYLINIAYNTTSLNTPGGETKKTGLAVRLVKDATGIPDGTTTTYPGNDGKVYNAVAINELYWTTENLEETQYRNGDPIPEVTDNTTWAGLSTGAWCTYDNNANYRCK